jgi:imidazolonepropionase-like amidohydrolase
MRALALALVTLATATTAAADRVVLRAARMFDGKSDRVVSPGTVVVEGNRIIAIGGEPSGGTFINLGDVTLMPGLMDAHTHLSGEMSDDWKKDELDMFKKELVQRAIEATEYARRTLMSGFTTVRDLGSDHFIDVGLRNAIDAGRVVGPRMLVAGNAIGARGGHCDEGAGYRQGLLRESDFTNGVADGPDQIRSAVRYTIMHGANVVKVCASGGVLSLTDRVDSAQLTQAELDATRRTRSGARRRRTRTAPRRPSARCAPASTASSTAPSSTTKGSTSSRSAAPGWCSRRPCAWRSA